MKTLNRILVLMLSLSILLLLMPACSSSGGSGYSRSSIHYGYRGYRGHPWGYDGVYIPGGGGVDPDWGVGGPSGPVAVPLPEMGMPDMGGMDFDF